MTRVIVIRHGETEWNSDGRYMGHLDAPLTQLGREQAQLIAERLRHSGVDAVYSSDLGRAVETALIIAASCGVEVMIDSRLRERDMGIFQGLTKSQIATAFPDELAHYEKDFYGYAIPQGESGAQHAACSLEGISDIAQRHDGHTIVVVTHGGVLLSLFDSIFQICGRGATSFKRNNASYSMFEYAFGVWILETLNDLSHLERRPR